MKKLLTLLLVLFVLVGCGGGKAEKAEVTQAQILQNVNVRKAMSYAINRDELVASLNDGSAAAEGIIPFNLAYGASGNDYRVDAGAVVAYDAAKAKEYFAKACEELGVDSITIDLMNGTNEGESVSKAATLIQAYLEEVGFNVNRIEKQKKERLALEGTGDFGVALTRWGPDYADPQTYMDLFTSWNADNNYGLYDSEAYDNLVIEAEAAGTTADQRWQNWIDAEKQLVAEDAGVVPVFQLGKAMITRPGVTGISINPAFVDSYRHIAGKDDVTVMTETDVLSWDSCIATDGTSFVAQWMAVSGLTEYNKSGVVLDLAESIDCSEDGLTYTIKIKDAANWENGTPVTSDDFIFAWDRLADPATASEYSWWLDTMCIESYAKVDDKTFTVQLSQPCAIFEQCLSFPCMFPINEAFYTACGDKFATDADNLLACGPFKVANWTQGESYSFVKNPTYVNAADYASAPAKVTFKVVADGQTGLMAYEQGTLDTVLLSGEQVSANEGKEGFEKVLQGYLYYLQININHYAE